MYDGGATKSISSTGVIDSLSVFKTSASSMTPNSSFKMSSFNSKVVSPGVFGVLGVFAPVLGLDFGVLGDFGDPNMPVVIGDDSPPVTAAKSESSRAEVPNLKYIYIYI